MHNLLNFFKIRSSFFSTRKDPGAGPHNIGNGPYGPKQQKQVLGMDFSIVGHVPTSYGITFKPFGGPQLNSR